MSLISIVTPCYNEEKTIDLLYEKLLEVTDIMKKDGCTFEFVFVDDGSSDLTLDKLKALNNMDSRVKYFSFSRNFGKESAIYCGLKETIGDYVVLMDADLQDPPELMIEMYRDIADGQYDCIGTRRTTRAGEPKIRSFFAESFYKVMRKISKVDMKSGVRDYRMMTRQMVNSVLEVNEYGRFSKGIFAWVGYNCKYLEYKNVERVAGETKWSFWKLLIYSFDGIVSFSTVPLYISTFVGLIFCVVSLLVMVFFIAKTLLFGDPVAGYPSLICFVLFSAGVQLFCTGILGQYLSKTYLEVKKRPLFIVREKS